MTLQETTDKFYEQLRFAEALRMLAEMRAQVGPECSAGIGVCSEWPAAYYSWPPERQRAWAVANPINYAKPGDPDDLARAIETAHANWKRSKNDDSTKT